MNDHFIDTLGRAMDILSEPKPAAARRAHAAPVRYDESLALDSMGELSNLAAANNVPCTNDDPEVMFPHPGDYSGVAQAKAICAACPIKMTCLSTSIRHYANDGVWGGASEHERSATRRVLRGVDPAGSHAPQDDDLFSMLDALAMQGASSE